MRRSRTTPACPLQNPARYRGHRNTRYFDHTLSEIRVVLQNPARHRGHVTRLGQEVSGYDAPDLRLITGSWRCQWNALLSRRRPSRRVLGGSLGVDASAGCAPLVPARAGLGDAPPLGLFHLVAAAAARARVAQTCSSAPVIGNGMLEVRFAGVPGAGRERARPVPDLDQVAEGVTRLVGMGLVPVITLGHR